MTTVAEGIEEQTLFDGYSFSDYLDAIDTLATLPDSSYAGLCVYTERPDPTPAPTILDGSARPSTAAPSSQPTLAYEALVVISACTLTLDDDAAAALNVEASPEYRAFQAGINNVTTLIDRDEQCFGISSSLATTRRRLLQADSAYTVEYNIEIELETTDAAEAAALVSNYTEQVQADLTAGMVDSDAFVNAVVRSLADQGSSSSTFSQVAVDKNATAAQVEAVVIFVQTSMPTSAPTPGPKKGGSSSSSDSLLIIIIVVVVGVLVVFGSVAFYLYKRSGRVTKVDVYADKSEDNSKPKNAGGAKTVPT